MAQKKKKKKWILIVIVLALILALTGWIVKNMIASGKRSAQDALVMTHTVEKQDLTDYVSLVGQIDGINTYSVTSSVTAKVKTLNVKVGDEVKEGDILCEFDKEDLQEQIDDLKKSNDKVKQSEERTHDLNSRGLERAKESRTEAINRAQRAINDAIKARDDGYAQYNNKVAEANRLYAQADALYNQLLQEEADAAATLPAPQNSHADTEHTGSESSSADSTGGSGSGDTYDIGSVPILGALFMQVSAEEFDESTSAYGGGSLLMTQYQQVLAQAQQADAEAQALYSSLSSLDAAVTAAQDAYDDAVKTADAAVEQAQDTIDSEDLQSTGTETNDAQIRKLEKQLEDCVVKAPHDGIVTELSVAEGGMPTSGALMNIVDTSQLVVTGSIKEADILRVKVGQKVNFTTDATGEEVTYTGKVSRLENVMSGSQSGAQDMYGGNIATEGYKIEILIDEDQRLMIGMSAKVKIMLEDKSDVVAVPYDYIYTNEDGSSVVFKIEESKQQGMVRLRAVPVTPGMETDYLTEITGGGIEIGDRLYYAEEMPQDGAEVPDPDAASEGSEADA